MPQVPYSPVPDVSAQDIPSPTIRLDVPGAAFGTNIADSVRRMGSTLGEAGNEITSRALAMQELRNQSEATQAVADYMKKGDDKFVQFEALRGRNAVDAEAAHRQDQDDLRIQTRDSLSNDRVRKDFDRAALSIQRQYTISGARHAAAENRSAANNASQARIDVAVSSSRYNQSPEDFQAGLNSIKEAAMDQAVLGGLDKDSANQHVWKWQSAAIAKRIQDTAVADPVGGKKLFDAAMANGQLHSQDVDKTRNFVNAHLDTTATRTIANSVDDQFRNPERFLASRGAPRATGVDPVFGQRLTAALMAAERATGETAKVNSLVRSTDEQAALYKKYQEGGNLAAPPGWSRHEFGRAVDLAPGKVLDWVRDHADEYGLETLKGPRSKLDTVHIQLADKDVPAKVRTDLIPEREYIAAAKDQAQKIAPDNPEFVERAGLTAQANYRRNLELDRQEDAGHKQAIADAFTQDNPPQTLEDLLKIPSANNAYYQLEPKDRLAVQRQIAQAHKVTDAEEFRRLNGLRLGSDEDRQEFLNEDIMNNRKISLGHWSQLMNWQAQARKQGEVDPKITQAVNTLVYSGTISEEQRKDKEFMPQLRGALWDAITTYEKVNKTYPKREEILEIGKGLVKEVNPQRTDRDAGFMTGRLGFGGTILQPAAVPAFQKARQEIIEKAAKSNNGIPPTEEEIRQFYREGLYQELYGKKAKKSEK